ncbi:hypothetical protein GUITHDRAFT_102051 [Guillardia theta CCMP2712]|uniref:Uncharacterized protein n=2 Tax=Guillardia theta TaxID=55529 RepID=L1JVB7_GUITC|nr:hypothetical protein GUITHDRAFT_102051 [Guillardia theta CCMP2712]EKX52150.1 hypothetical protein GUITHDRAFT_102051 [Guillardia theta CCMP2712]|mmetsp:Transcript_14390/g.49148  ORF Transcript_14390/g.49148 Transcript_14390/m.49148 type:complete len:385 (+) Transcript_14390:55-1209(+)|eukprot:XP_005839130.1 hypothetical protein GUITHDRAFT_102051 [Guillardia theta CCMP2712]
MSSGSKRRIGEAFGNSDRDKHQNNKTNQHLSPEEQLAQAVSRLEDIRNGTDDELIRESEDLSRKRDEQLNALLAKGSGGHSKGNLSRSSVEAQRRTICDEFESARAKAQDRLRTEMETLQQWAQGEIETAANSGMTSRVRRKTRARGEADGFLADREKASSIIYRLQELQQRVILTKDDLDRDLDTLRSKAPKTEKESSKTAKTKQAEEDHSGKKTNPSSKAPVSSNSAPSKANTSSSKSDKTANKSEKSAPATNDKTSKPASSSSKSNTNTSAKAGSSSKANNAQANGKGTAEKSARQDRAENRAGSSSVYTSKGVLYMDKERFEKGDAVSVILEDGTSIKGTINTINSLELRIQQSEGDSISKVYLSHLKNKKASLHKQEES